MKRDELYELFSSYLSEQATDEQIDQLNDVIRSDKAAARMLVEMSDTHMCLAVDESLWLEDIPAASVSDNVEPNQRGLQRRGVRPAIAYAGWLSAVAALCAVCLQFFSDGPVEQTGIPNDLPAPFAQLHAAIIKQQIDVEWADETKQFNTGEPLDDQLLNIESGVLQIEFGSSAQLSLQGPAELQIESDMECYLKHGKLTVLAPPEAAEFTVKSPTANVVDLGTEFGLTVALDGQTDVHVLQGEVEVETIDDSERVQKKTLAENEAATVAPDDREIELAEIDREAFEPIRYETILARRPIKLQFDCGSRAGLYQGTESPAHAAGFMQSHEEYWNSLVGDSLGSLILADGSLSTHAIEIDYGASKTRVVDWDARANHVHKSICKSVGVFDTALGRDQLRVAGTVGLRIRGLPSGRYRVFFIGRSTAVGKKHGDFLTDKAFRSAIDVNLDAIPTPHEIIMPVEDSVAAQWVDGQTHLVGEVELSGPDDWLTVLTRKDKRHSQNPNTGHSEIVGLQIVQISGAGPEI